MYIAGKNIKAECYFFFNIEILSNWSWKNITSSYIYYFETSKREMLEPAYYV